MKTLLLLKLFDYFAYKMALAEINIRGISIEQWEREYLAR